MDTPLPTLKRRGRIAGAAFLLAGFVFANAGTLSAVAVARPGLFPTSETAQVQEMTAAQAAARSHLDRFFQSVIDADGVARQGAAVRVVLHSLNGRSELIWVTPFARQGAEYFGTLAATPRQSRGPIQGDLIRFRKPQIVDWSFFGEDGRMYGNFTTRMILNTVSPARAAEIAALLSASPAPKDW